MIPYLYLRSLTYSPLFSFAPAHSFSTVPAKKPPTLEEILSNEELLRSTSVEDLLNTSNVTSDNYIQAYEVLRRLATSIPLD
jgi:hypothetical protein